MNIKNKYFYVISWYIFPFLYLLLVKEVFLPAITLVLMIYFFGLIVGGIFSKNIEIKTKNSFSPNKISNAIIYITLLLQSLAFLRFYLFGFDIQNHRDQVWENANLLFGSAMLFPLYVNFLIPLSLCVALFHLASDKSKGDLNKKFIYLPMLILIFDAIIMFGRFQLMFVLFILFFHKKTFKIKNIYFIIIGMVFFVLSQAIIFFRQFYVDSAVDSFSGIFSWEIIEKGIIGYQYYGYLLFEKFINSRNIANDIISFNLFNFPVYICQIIFSKIGILIENPWEATNLILTQATYIREIDTEANAFSTNFLPFYLDFGFLGILLFGLYSGFIFSYSTKSNFFIFIKNAFFFITIFGIYQPIILNLIGLIVSPVIFVLFARISIKKYNH